MASGAPAIVRVELADGLTPGALRALLRALVETNMDQLRRHPRMPQLYGSGVRYQREGRERFSDAAATLRRGYGDCEDLAAWRVAELRNAGEDARPAFRLRTFVGGPPLYHVLVARGDGRIEDPSRRLGMP